MGCSSLAQAILQDLSATVKLSFRPGRDHSGMLLEGLVKYLT
jgi:hypothetical protein